MKYSMMPTMAPIEIILILLLCVTGLGLFIYLYKRINPEIETYDNKKADLIAQYMIILLTELKNRLIIYNPIDVKSVWHEPFQDKNGKWVYRAKADAHPNAPMTDHFLRDYIGYINRRAKDTNRPIKVINVYREGLFIVFDVELTM